MRHLLAFTVSILTLSGSLLAAPCQQASLDVYLAVGFQCEIENLEFSAFSYTASGNGEFTIPTTSDVTVTPGSISALQRFLQFTSSVPWSIVAPSGGGNSINAFLTFTVSGLGDVLVEGAEISALGFNTGSGSNVGVTDTIPGIVTISADFSNTGTTPIASSQSAVFPAQQSITVTKHIKVNAGSEQDAAITEFTQSFTETPEPSTLGLMGSVLFALGAWKRSRR